MKVVGTKLLQMSSESPHLDAYNSYIDFEIKSGDPVRVISIIERAICENCLQPELWLRYTKYVVSLNFNVVTALS
jgi:squamous cell carcinoma antigen recognized by T-cells 3